MIAFFERFTKNASQANGMAGKDIKEIVASEKFRARLLADFTARADEKKLKNFERIRDASKIFCEYVPRVSTQSTPCEYSEHPV